MGIRTDHKLELLKRVPLFAGLSARDIEQVGRLAEEVDLPRDKVLMREGASGDEFFIVVEGTVRIERGGAGLRSMGPGDFLGEIALIDNGPRTATATAETPLKVFVLAHREFHSLMDGYPTIRACVFEALAARVRRLEPETPH